MVPQEQDTFLGNYIRAPEMFAHLYLSVYTTYPQAVVPWGIDLRLTT